MKSNSCSSNYYLRSCDKIKPAHETQPKAKQEETKKSNIAIGTIGAISNEMKVVLAKSNKLPQVIENKLSKKLNDLNILLENNKEFHKELLIQLSKSEVLDDADIIKTMIEDEYENQDYDLTELLGSAGSIVALISGDHAIYKKSNVKPIFSNIIKKMLEHGQENS